MKLSGSYVALITPFHPDGSVKFEKLAEMCEWHVQNGTDGIVALGTKMCIRDSVSAVPEMDAISSAPDTGTPKSYVSPTTI